MSKEKKRERHSKIDMDVSEIDDQFAALDLEGISITNREKKATPKPVDTSPVSPGGYGGYKPNNTAKRPAFTASKTTQPSYGGSSTTKSTTPAALTTTKTSPASSGPSRPKPTTQPSYGGSSPKSTTPAASTTPKTSPATSPKPSTPSRSAAQPAQPAQSAQPKIEVTSASAPSFPTKKAPPPSTTPTSSAAATQPKAMQSAPAVGAKGGGLANRWMQQQQDRKAAEREEERQKIRGRRGRATAFVDKEIRAIIAIMQQKPGRKCSYGELFRDTQDTLSALSATLAMARKKGVVDFEGQAMLMQGTHDHVMIILLRDELEDTAVFQSVYVAPGANPFAKEPTPKGPEKCVQCGKTVYPNERVAANGKIMHKSCFRCCQCNMVLKLASYAYNGDKFFCEPHFKQAMSAKASYDF